MAQRPFSAKGFVMRHHRGTWLVSKRLSGEYIMEQDMACWKVVARVSQNTVCGLLEGLLEGRCESIAEEHSTWLVGRLVGRSNHGNHGTKSILGNGRSCRHRGPPVVILGKTSETMVIMGNRVGTTVTMGKKGRSYVQSMARGPFWA